MTIEDIEFARAAAELRIGNAYAEITLVIEQVERETNMKADVSREYLATNEDGRDIYRTRLTLSMPRR